jgi:hypothetical protein
MTATRTGLERLEEDLARQRADASSSPSYVRALGLLPSVLASGARRLVEASWAGRRFFAWYERPLLLLAALRNDALAEGPAHPLWAGFAAPEPSADEVTEERLRAGLDPARERVRHALAHRFVQTNETSRALSWLWPAALAGASGGLRPVALADVGASAGLNLVADELPAIWTDEAGAPLEVAAHVRAVARVGLDREPVDALDEDGARWLRACVWPGARAREARLLAAIGAFRAARTRRDAPVLVPIGLASVPARLGLLSAAERGALVIAYQTVVRDYLAPDERGEYEAGMRAWLATRPPGQALWIELEGAAEGGEPPAAIAVHVRPPRGAPRTIELGRCAFHPSVVRRNPAGEAELRALLASEAHATAGP